MKARLKRTRMYSLPTIQQVTIMVTGTSVGGDLELMTYGRQTTIHVLRDGARLLKRTSSSWRNTVHKAVSTQKDLVADGSVTPRHTPKQMPDFSFRMQATSTPQLVGAATKRNTDIIGQ